MNKVHSVALRGIRVSSYSFEEVLLEIKNAIHKKKKTLLFALNIHSLRLIHNDQRIRRAFLNAQIVFPDGVPLLWLIRAKTQNILTRVSGTDLVNRLLLDKEMKLFLLGSSDDVLEKIVQKYHRRKEGGNIVGFYSPSHSDLFDPEENRKIIAKINKSKPTILLVALGQPKQEFWLTENLPKTVVSVGIGVGSAFDILSGKTPRAPQILKNHGFEWAWRILNDPNRLFVRYFFDWIFLLKAVFFYS